MAKFPLHGLTRIRRNDLTTVCMVRFLWGSSCFAKFFFYFSKRYPPSTCGILLLISCIVSYVNFLSKYYEELLSTYFIAFLVSNLYLFRFLHFPLRTSKTSSSNVQVYFEFDIFYLIQASFFKVVFYFLLLCSNIIHRTNIYIYRFSL